MGCGASTNAGATGTEGEKMSSKPIGTAPKPTIEEVQPFDLEDSGDSITITGDPVTSFNDMDEVNRLLEIPDDQLQAGVDLTLATSRSKPPAAVQGESTSIGFDSLKRIPSQASKQGKASEALAQKEVSQQYATLQRSIPQRAAGQQSQEVEGVPSDDPWASIQSQYQVRNVNDDADGMGKGQGRLNGGNSFAKRDEGIIVFSDDEGSLKPVTTELKPGLIFGLSGGRSKNLPPIKYAGGAKSGGWGQGDMAKPGELMLGDEDDIINAASGKHKDTDMERNNKAGMADIEPTPTGAKARSKVVDDLGMEDIDDVDALLNEEMENQGLNKDLAAKLRAFEAMNDDD